jgi:hypothetical protein
LEIMATRCAKRHVAMDSSICGAAARAGQRSGATAGARCAARGALRAARHALLRRACVATGCTVAIMAVRQLPPKLRAREMVAHSHLMHRVGCAGACRATPLRHVTRAHLSRSTDVSVLLR